ncbi:MAG: kelch repeat-containing protein [Sulfurisoma sp.]|nr:kelch repeat-containing protein [Sulfurisoma sp.]
MSAFVNRSNPLLWFMVLLIATFLAGWESTAFAAPTPASGSGAWTTEAPMPTARWGAASGVINGKLYVAGGWRSGTSSLATLEVYDPATNTWATKAPMPTARGGAGGAVINGKLYVVGGDIAASQKLATLEVYDPTTDTWTTKAPMPTPRSLPGAVAIDGQLYVAGGCMGWCAPTTNVLQVYDPTTDTWTTKAPLPTARGSADVAVVNGLFYVMGGCCGFSTPESELMARTIEVYNPTTNTWTTKTQHLVGSGGTAGSINGKIYVAEDSAATEVYDPAADTWASLSPMTVARYYTAGGVIDGKLYVAGGWSGTGGTAVLEALSVAEAAPAPYTSDANTVLLDHLDGATSASVLAYSEDGVVCGAYGGSPKPSATPNSAYVTGPSGLSQALSLGTPVFQPAGSNTYLQYPGGQLLSQANGTIEFWTYLTTYGPGVGLVRQGPFPGSCAGWTFSMDVTSTGQLSAGAWAAFSLNSGATTVPLNTWTHVAASWGSSGAKLYINGVQVGSDVNTGMPASGYGGSVLVNYGAGGIVTQIDELRISNVQRTSFALGTVAAPAAPTGVQAIPGNSQATISWNAVSGATSYNVYMATQSGVTKTSTTLAGFMAHTAVTSPYVHTGLTNGTPYYFVVTAVNASGESIESSQVSATPAEPTWPTSSADCVFSWGERGYPGLFSPAPAISESFGDYYYRFYSGTNSYLGVSIPNQRLVYVGRLSGNTLLDLGALATWIRTAGCQTDRFPVASNWAASGAAFDGTNYLVSLESDTQTAAVAAQMMSSTDARVGSVISIGRSGQSCCSAVAFDGANYLMIWEEDQGIKNSWAPFMIYGQFIDTAGAAMGLPFPMTTSGISQDGVKVLAYGGGKYLLTYTRLIIPANGDNANNRYIAGRIISPDGSMGNEFRISNGFGASSSMAFDGTNFFVVWTEDSQDYEVRGRFVSASGTLGQEISINASLAPSDIPPAVAFDGANYLVAWNDEVGGRETDEWDIFGQRVSPNGALVGNVIPIVTEAGPQVVPTLAFDGTNYLAVWIDAKTDANHNNICDAGEGTCWDVYGQYIGKDGALVGNKITISTDAGNQMGGAISFNGKSYVGVNSGIVMGEGGPTQVGDTYGVFITP